MVLRPNEVRRLKEELNNVPPGTSIELTREVTSEFGYTIFLNYYTSHETKIDLTQMDNF